jgi:hypothetical protein
MEVSFPYLDVLIHFILLETNLSHLPLQMAEMSFVEGHGYFLE